MTVLDLIERLQHFNPDDTVVLARVIHRPTKQPERLCRGVETVNTVRIGDVRHVALYVTHVMDRRLL